LRDACLGREQRSIAHILVAACRSVSLGRMHVQMLPVVEPAIRAPRVDDGQRIADAVVRAGRRVVFLDDETHGAGIAYVPQRAHNHSHELSLAEGIAVDALTGRMYARCALEAPRRYVAVGIESLDYEPAVRVVVVPLCHAAFD